MSFPGDARLGKSYKLSASKILILMEFTLTQASLTINLSNLILCQIFLLYGTYIMLSMGITSMRN